jgi:hypothetical protein
MVGPNSLESAPQAMFYMEGRNNHGKDIKDDILRSGKNIFNKLEKGATGPVNKALGLNSGFARPHFFSSRIEQVSHASFENKGWLRRKCGVPQEKEAQLRSH